MHQMNSAPVTVDVDAEPPALRQRTLVPALEWRAVCEGRYNLLLEGPEASTNAALLLLKPHLIGIVHWKQWTAPLELPPRTVRTLILENVDSLSATDQTSLLTWMAAADTPIQIVSTTTQSLFPFVVRGLFDERLYYRLNTVFLHIA
jgi:hypothetical protein